MKKSILAFAAIFSLTLAAFVAQATPALDFTRTVDKANAAYFGARWAGTTICIQNKIGNPMIRQAMKDAVWDFRENTVLWTVNMGKTGCGNYEHVIDAYAKNYGPTGWVGVFDHGSNWHWGRADNGDWTWLFHSPVSIKLNTYYIGENYYDKPQDWQRVAAHELGHAVGLNHVSDTCDALMSNKPDCSYKPHELLPVDITGTTESPGINRLYGRHLTAFTN